MSYHPTPEDGKLHLKVIETGIRFEDHIAVRLLVGLFLTCISCIGLISIKNEIQLRGIESSSIFYTGFMLFFSVLGLGYGLCCLFYQSYIDIDIKRKKIRLAKRFLTSKTLIDEHDFLALKHIILAKEFAVDMDRKPQIVYSITIETLSGQAIKIDNYFDKQKAQNIAERIAELTSLRVLLQNRTANEQSDKI